MQVDESLQEAEERDRGFKIATLDEQFHQVVREVNDAKLVGTQIAALAGAHPAEEFRILRWSAAGELSLVNFNELVELRHGLVEYFFVIRSSELFFLTLDGLSLAWPLPAILVAHLRKIVRLGDDVELVLSLRDEADRVLEEDEFVRLDAPGLERIYTRKVHIVIEIDDTKETLDHRMVTPNEIIKLVGKDPSQNYLIEFRKGSPPENFRDKGDVPLRLHSGMRFGVLSTGPTTVS